MKQVLVSEELLRQVLNAACSPYCAQDLGQLMPAIRAALEQTAPVQEPEIAGYVNPTSLSVMRIGEFDWIKLYPDNTGGHIPLYTEPQAQTQPPILTEVEVERLTVFAGLHDIETPLLAEFIRAIERVVRRQFRQTRTAPQAQQPAPVQEPVAWWKQYPDGNVSVVEGKVFLTEDALYRGWRPLGFADAAPQAQQPTPVQEPVAFVSPDDLEDMRGPEYAAGAYFRMRATPAGKYVQPIYTAQPRTAVKLSDSEIASDASRHWSEDGVDPIAFAHAIESAVWAKNGWAE